MAVSIELARNQYLKAAWLKDNDRKHTLEATVAKLYASEMLEKVASDALHIHGGYGYMNEYPISRYYKGAKLLQNRGRHVRSTAHDHRPLAGRPIIGHKRLLTRSQLRPPRSLMGVGATGPAGPMVSLSVSLP